MAQLYALRIRLLRELNQAIQLLYGEIEYAATDMVEILWLLGERGEYFRPFFGQVARSLEERNGEPLYHIWEREADRLSRTGENRLAFTREDIRFLKGLGKNLGNVDRATQLHTLGSFQRQLEGMIAQAEESCRGQAKICRVVGTVGGLLTAVLLF